MSLGNVNKCISHNVFFPSKIDSIPFTVPSLLDKNKRHKLLQKNLSPYDGCSDNYKWSSEPFLTVGGFKRDSGSSGTSDEKNKSCDSIMFGIDPSLYREQDPLDLESSFDEDNIGRLWFAVQYNPEAERLAVSLIQLRNLPSRVRGVNNGCDPYVRICLLPDEKRYLQSQNKKKTCNPKFDENFIFQVSVGDVRQRSLKFAVYDINRNKNHVIIGQVIYPLKMFDLSTKVALWRDLESESAAGNKPEASDVSQLYMSLTYNGQLNRLTVGLYKGRNFTEPDEMDKPYEYYVRVMLAKMNKILKQKKSASVKSGGNPVFNEMFKLRLSSSDIDSVSLSAVVYLKQQGSKETYLGRVVLGSFMFARGVELEHWSEMANNEKQQISRWHNLVV